MHTHHAVPVEFRQYTSHYEKGDGRKKTSFTRGIESWSDSTVIHLITLEVTAR